MKIVLSIRSLDVGGAERQFIELVKHIDKSKFDVLVCTMYGGVQEEIIKNIPNIKYVNLEKKGRYNFFEFYKKYKKLLNEFDPDVIYSFLGEMNLFSYWVKPKYSKVIWGVRASNMDLKRYGKLPQLLFWLQKKYSKKTNRIITNSQKSIEVHKKLGFYMNKAIVIHNGIDVERFKRNDDYRNKFRDRFDLSEDDIAIGTVARIDAMKGYPILAKAMKKIFTEYKNINFFAVGDGDRSIKKECENILGKYNNSKWHWLGEMQETEKIYNSLDIYVSSSFGEGFSNSIAEAMACEVPCVVTDVGDSALIVGDFGIVVNPGSSRELAQGIEKMLQSDYRLLGKKSRERIVYNFSIEKMVQSSEREILKCVD
jgi:glycosyltransferase involved in cell wall biosynthesis